MDKDIADKLVKHLGDAKTQNILIAQCVYSFDQILNSPSHNTGTKKLILLNFIALQAKNGLIDFNLASRLIDELVSIQYPNNSTTNSITISSNGSSNDVHQGKQDTKDQEDVKKFDELMKKIESNSKGKKNLQTTKEMKELVKLIDSYNGNLSVMNNVKELLNKRKTEKEKLQVIKNFVKSVI